MRTPTVRIHPGDNLSFYISCRKGVPDSDAGAPYWVRSHQGAMILQLPHIPSIGLSRTVKTASILTGGAIAI